MADTKQKRPDPVDNPEVPDFGKAPVNTKEARKQSLEVLKHGESMAPDPSQEGADAIKTAGEPEDDDDDPATPRKPQPKPSPSPSPTKTVEAGESGKYTTR